MFRVFRKYIIRHRHKYILPVPDKAFMEKSKHVARFEQKKTVSENTVAMDSSPVCLFIQASTRHAKYVQSNTEALSRKHCCSGTIIIIIYLYVCVCVGEGTRV